MIFVKDSWPGERLSGPSLSEADFQLRGKLQIVKGKLPTAKSPAFISTSLYVVDVGSCAHGGMDRLSPSGCFWKVWCGSEGGRGSSLSRCSHVSDASRLPLRSSPYIVSSPLLPKLSQRKSDEVSNPVLSSQ